MMAMSNGCKTSVEVSKPACSLTCTLNHRQPNCYSESTYHGLQIDVIFFCQRGHLSARRLKSAPISRYGNYLLSPQHLISAIVSLMDLAYSGQMHLTTYLGIQLDLGHLRYKPRGTGIRSRHSVPVRSKDIMSASPK